MQNMLGKRIASLREEKKLNQIELAKLLSISNTTLSQYEAGNRIPGNDILWQIADYFNVSIDYLFGRTNARNYQEEKIKTETIKQAEDIIKVDPDLFVQMCRATYLPEEDRKKISEYSAMLLEKHLREQDKMAKKNNDIQK